MQGLLNYYIKAAQKQYFEYIQKKLRDLKHEANYSRDKIIKFKINLIEKTLRPNDEKCYLYDAKKQTLITNSRVSSIEDIEPASSTRVFPKPPQEKLEASDESQKQLNTCYRIFLQNYLCKNIQFAMLEVNRHDQMEPQSQCYGPIPMTTNL